MNLFRNVKLHQILTFVVLKFLLAVPYGSGTFCLEIVAIKLLLLKPSNTPPIENIIQTMRYLNEMKWREVK